MGRHLVRRRKRYGRVAERGASAVEYGLMVAAVAALIVGVVFALGGRVNDAFNTTCASLTVPLGGSCTSSP